MAEHCGVVGYKKGDRKKRLGYGDHWCRGVKGHSGRHWCCSEAVFSENKSKRRVADKKKKMN